MNHSTTIIFYSFRRCPYAMRARLALVVADITVELREIELSAKPAALLAISPKGTVPVLLLPNGKVLEESLDIMYWALQQNDSQHWLDPDSLASAQQLILQNDGEFKYYLDRYKYADRYPEYPPHYYRQQTELFIAELESRLLQTRYLCSENFSLADAAILPFIRQFVAVDTAWFEQAGYTAVQSWLSNFVESKLFASIMAKYPVWQDGNEAVLFVKS